MVAHEAPGEEFDLVVDEILPHAFPEEAAVFIVLEDDLLSGSARHDVVDVRFALRTVFSGHGSPPIIPLSIPSCSIRWPAPECGGDESDESENVSLTHYRGTRIIMKSACR